MAYPAVTKINHSDPKDAYQIAISREAIYHVSKAELIRLFEEIDEALPPNTIERTISERVAALERTIGECPCHK